MGSGTTHGPGPTSRAHVLCTGSSRCSEHQQQHHPHPCRRGRRVRHKNTPPQLQVDRWRRWRAKARDGPASRTEASQGTRGTVIEAIP